MLHARREFRVVLVEDPEPQPRMRSRLIPVASLATMKAVLARPDVKMREVFKFFRAGVYLDPKSPVVPYRAKLLEAFGRECSGPIARPGEAIELHVLACWTLPKSLHKKRDPLPLAWQIARGAGDWDNVGKVIADVATEAKLWADDCQVARCTVEKIRAEQGEAGFVAVAARPLAPEPRLSFPYAEEMGLSKAEGHNKQGVFSWQGMETEAAAAVDRRS